MAVTDVEADLQWHRAALSKLQGELMASRLEVSGARGETVQLKGMLRRAQAEAAEQATAHDRIARLQADVAGRDAEITRLHAVIASLQAETQALKTGMDILRASLSWRISAPVRFVGQLIRGIVRTRPNLRQAIQRPRTPLDHAGPAVKPPPAPLTPPWPLSGPQDPTTLTISQVASRVEHPAEAKGVVTLDALYQLSRTL